jgi:hypothetical protein
MTAKTQKLIYSRACYTLNIELKKIRNGLNYNYNLLTQAVEILKDFAPVNKPNYLQKRIDKAFEKRINRSEIQNQILDNLWASFSGEVITLCPATC